MKKLLLLLATIITLTAKAQTSVYFPFPDSAIVWRQEGYVQGFSCCCSGTLCLKEEDFQYFLNGDTLIGAFVYKKIYQSGSGVEHIVGQYNCPPWCTSNDQYYSYNNNYAGSFRQDTAQRKIFFMPPGFTQDTLLYDFNLNAGDTLPPSWTNSYLNYVTAIDSILIGGFYHKRFQLSGSAFPNEVAIIEGIGNSLGLLSPLLTNANVSNFYNILLCVTVNSIPVYPDTATACNLVSQINDVRDNLAFSIIPNPFSEKLNIKLNNFTTAEFVLYDIASRKLLQQKFTNTVTLNTAQLAKGIYIYEVRLLPTSSGNGKEGVRKGKVVKE